MAADKNIILSALLNAQSEGGAVVFTIGDHYVQAAAASPGEMLCEAVSHHYHSGIDIALESSFTQTGFMLEDGGNYSRKYSVIDSASIEQIADDIMKIFEEIYHSDISLPFEVSEV